MNELQRNVLQSMKDVLRHFEEDGMDLGILVATLRGLYESAGIQDADLRTSFEVAWVSLDHEQELRTESWADPGDSTPDSLNTAVAGVSSWIESVLGH